MSFRHAASRPSRSQRSVHAALLASVSVLTLLVAVPSAHARSLGGSAVSPAGTAATATLVSAQQAAASAQRALQSMTRASQAIQAMQALQAAARNAALAAPGTVPNGLVAGGLVPDSGLSGPGTANPVSTWVNAKTPTQTSDNSQTTVTIKQTAPKAILNWQSFHVGRDTTVRFDQSDGNDSSGNGWIALNRVDDPTGVPSRILGQIKADGAVYLINRNGIIFGGSSQINVATLLASTLGITDAQYANGILYQASGDANTVAPAFTGTPGQTAALTVEAGAAIAATSGGKVLLLGGNVTNAGSISTPQGQTILASGDKVFLEQSTDGLRGIVANVESGLNATYDAKNNVFVRGAAGSGWTAQNDGLISADVGNITLVGQNVTQNGVLTATSSATLDGSIRLWARTDQLVSSTKATNTTPATIAAAYRGAFGGTLTLGDGSLTQVRADLNSSDYLLDSTTFKASAIDLLGKTVVLRANSTILGEAANVTMRAADMVIVSPSVINTGNASITYADRPDDGSRIYLNSGSLIDVSGLQNVPLAMEQNSVAAEMRSAEFADYPQLRDSALRNRTIYFDRRVSGVRSDGTPWVGTSYGDVSAWLALGHFGAGQLMSTGGSVRIDSLGSAILRSGSQIFAAGGSLCYASGYVKTSKILWNGRRYDISQATPDMVGAILYDGTFTVDHAHWNVKEIYSSPLSGKGHLEQGYVQGQSGGQVLVTARHAVLDGGLDVSAGIGDALRGNAAAAAGGKLTFGEASSGTPYDRTMPDVVVGSPTSALGAGFTQGSALTGDLASTVYIRPDLINDSGAKDVAINTDQIFILNQDATITLAPGGSFNVVASRAVINGTIRAPAGDITVIARLGNQQSGVANAFNKLARTITIGPNAVLDVTGLWIDLTDGSTPIYSKAWLNGGNVTLSSERAFDPNTAAPSGAAGHDGDLTVSAGSLIDASSGGLRLANGRLATSQGVPLGNGGTISLIGSALEKIQSNPGLQTVPESVGRTVIAGELRAYGLGAGGSLAIAAATVQIGGNPSLTNSQLYLAPSFFQSGGFSNFRIIGWDGVDVAPGAVVEPKAKSFLANPAMLHQPTGSSLFGVASIDFKADQLRAPTNLALYAPDYGASNLTDTTSAPGPTDVYHPGDHGVAGDIILGAGSVIRTDPGATVDIRAARELVVDGTIEAPGGTINLANDQESGIAVGPIGPSNGASTIFHRANVTLWIGAGAQLLTQGVVQTFIDPFTRRRSSRAFDGGSVSLTGGNIVVQPGSVIDVSGATGSFVPSTQAARGQVVPQQLATAAGSITLTPGNYLYFDPILRVSGDASVRGATFAINPIRSVATSLPLTFNLPAPTYAGNGPAAPETAGSKILLRDGSGQASPVAHAGDALPAHAHPEFDVFEDSLQRARFDDLILSTLDGVIAFHSNTDLSARRSIQLLSRYIGGDGSVSVNITAPYVAFGGSFANSTGTITGGDPAASGTGSFTVNAGLIDFSGSTTFGVDPSLRNLAALSSSSPLLKTVAQAGFATINFFSSGDIRFNDNSPVPGSSTVAAVLNTYGDVTFRAAELYVLSRTGAGFIVNGYAVDTHTSTSTIKNSTSTITIRSNGNPAGVPLSANGSITIAAPHIVQRGTLRAPAGQITLTNATVTLATNLAAGTDTNIILTDGSLTSVDLEGALVPYGTTRNGTDFLINGRVATAPQKLITMTGNSIDVREGAVVSASGGGDLATYEFVPGPGGSTDVLSGRNVFAVIPTYRGALPKDSDWGGAGTLLKVGNSVYLSGIPGLAAGYYTLLPGYYALLPGAFRVTLNSANSDVGTGGNVRTATGGYLTAGYLADQFTHAQTSQRWSTFLVESGDVVRSRSQYNENKLSDFLSGVANASNLVAARLPNEPGRIAFNAASQLLFEGIARTTPIEGSRGGQIDISSGGAILITGKTATKVDGTLVLLASQLSNLQTESLMIGGTRSQTSADGNATILNGSSVTVGATSVTVDTQGTALSGSEIILVAQNSITVKSGSIIEASGPYRSAPSPDLLLDQGTTATPTAAQKANDGAAILSVSNSVKPNFVRGNSKTGTLPAIGNVTIQDGVTLNGGNSLLIDGATVTLAFGPTSTLKANAVTLGSNHVSIGNFAQASPPLGLQLNIGALAALSLINDLTLRSRETIDLYGNFTLGLDSRGNSRITLDSAGLVGTSNAGKTASVMAGTVNLVNSSGTANNLPAVGSGAFVVRATNANLGGNVFVDGMSSTELHATGSISSTSSGLFEIRHGTLALEAGQLTSAASVSRVIQVTNGTLTVSRSSAGSVTPTANAGGSRLQLIAQSIQQKGDIELPGGAVVLQATAGDVTFDGTSVTNAGGFSKDFYDVSRQAPAGRIDVIATGDVAVNAGAKIDVSSDGDAGTVTVTAGGKFDLKGTLDGQGGEGFRDGAFGLDAGTVSNFDQLNAILNAASFDRERNFRVRSGDVAIGANTTIDAHIFTLSTDNGTITVAGRIDASGAQPGSIRLTASSNVVLASGAWLDAQGVFVDDAGHGGTVSLETANGYVDVQAGSRIDLGAGGDNGVLNLRMPRKEKDGIDANNHLNGILTGAGAVNVEAFKVYNFTTLAATGSDPGTLTFATIDADNSAFVGGFGAAINTRLKGELTAANTGFDNGRLHLLAGAEVKSASDLTVTNAGNAVNFANYRYSGEAGVLTLRAAGNLNINGNISDGFTTASAATGKLLSASDAGSRSWSYRLIAGADTTASDVRQAHQAGDVSIAKSTLVRTGTGDIEVSAGRDVKFATGDSVLYTAGVGRDVTGLATPTNAMYGIDGGDITIVAGGNISDGNPKSANAGGAMATAPSDQLVTAWLYRQGNLDSNGVPVDGRPTSWWVNYATFQQGGVGALGGGNIRIKAGDARSESSGNINDLSVVVATTGLVNHGQLQFIAGGGDISIEATGNINSGLFYVAKGIGDIRTNRSFGSARIVSDTNSASSSTTPIFPILALGDARISLVAGGDIGIEAIFNPTVTMQVTDNATGLPGSPFSGFFTYTHNSAVSLTSVGGKAVVYSDAGVLVQTVSSSSLQFTRAQANARYTGDKIPEMDSTTIQPASLWPYQILPPTLEITAFNGDVGFDGGLTLYPSAIGTLDFLSAGSIRLMAPALNVLGNPVLGNSPGIAISDADPLRLPTPIAPDFNLASARARLLDSPSTDYTKETDVNRERLHATDQLHQGDPEPVRFYALNGDINFRTSTTATSASAIPIISAKSVRLRASRDILDLQLLAQNNTVTDLTLVRAGRDIKFPTSPGTANSDLVYVAGPGGLDIEAGRNLNLGNSAAGIQSIGDLRNPALGSGGATIILAAGMTDVHYSDFVKAYLDPATSSGYGAATAIRSLQPVDFDKVLTEYIHLAVPQAYDGMLVAFIQKLHPGLPAPTLQAARAEFQALPDGQQAQLYTVAWSAFATLSRDQQAPVVERAWQLFSLLPKINQEVLIRPVFYAELRASADHAAHSEDPKNLANYSQGFAAINTLFPTGAPRAGEIRLGSSRAATLDGGDIQLLAPAGGIFLGLNQLPIGVVQGGGLQTQQGGDILSMSYGDVFVAQAAVHTLGGGTIGMWSTTGDIDAGKGAKSRKNVVKPAFRTDMNGRTVFNPGSIATGAGLATLQAVPGSRVGDTWLATPQGFVDAGEAGIRVSGDLVIAAQGVLNAANITVQGTSVGIPTIIAPNIGALTSASNAAGSSTKAVEQPVGNGARQGQPSIIIVEVLGYGGSQDGDDSARQQRRDNSDPAPEQRSQNPNSAVQVVGAGPLSPRERQLLTDEERRKLD